MFIISHQNLDPHLRDEPRLVEENEQPFGVVLALAIASPTAKDDRVVALNACFVVQNIYFFTMDLQLPPAEPKLLRYAPDRPLYNLYGVLTSVQQPVSRPIGPLGKQDAMISLFFPSETAKGLDFVPMLTRLVEMDLLVGMEGREVVSRAALIESLHICGCGETLS